MISELSDRLLRRFWFIERFFKEKPQNITVNANVPKAKVYVNGMPMCSTPCAIDLKRSQSNTIIVLKKSGYEDATAVLTSQINPVSIINLSALYSWTTDFLSNGVWRYSPDSVYVEMEKTGMTQAERNKFNKISEIRRYVLFNYSPLKAGNAEHIGALSAATGLRKERLEELLKKSLNETDAAEKIVSAV